MSDKMVKKQLEMPVLTSKELDGIEMGVLEDGTPFLTGRGLALVCGVVPSAINPWANEYDANSGKKRDQKLYALLEAQGFEGDALFIKTKIEGQDSVNAYPEAVCMAFLEYYAFEAERRSEVAVHNYRRLARAGLKVFIYTALGYDPANRVPDAFKSYRDRVMLNRMPAGLFSCFTETAHIVLASIQAGLPVDEHTVPDISVGKLWSTYWTENKLDEKYGARSKYPHNYPDDYPQSAVTPDAFAYPIDALGEFRAWLDREYLPKKYPQYINRKVKAGALPASRAELLIEAVLPPPQLEAGEKPK